MARESSSATLALTLFAREPTWVELYTVTEIVADDVGGYTPSTDPG